MAIEWWTLPDSLGGHRVRAEKVALTSHPGYYSVKVPGFCNSILVPGDILRPELPDQPLRGSIALGRNGCSGPLPWSVYVRLTDSTSFGDHCWARADKEREMSTWARINKDHSEVVVLVNAGAGRVDWTGMSMFDTRVALEEDGDGDFRLQAHNRTEVALLDPGTARDLACAILSRLMGPT